MTTRGAGGARSRWIGRQALALLLAGAATACASGAGSARGRGGALEEARSSDERTPQPAQEAALVYEQMGLLASGGTLPFVARVAFMAGPTPDTTLAVVALSFPARALTFTRSGDVYRAGYVAGVELVRGPQAVRRVEAPQNVVVSTFRETTRSDESVIFQEVLHVAPGQYDLVVSVRDQGSTRNAAVRRALHVPRLEPGTLATPVPFYEAVLRGTRDSLPRVLASPRATVSFGRDSLLPLYLEGYGEAADSLRVLVRADGEHGAALWRDSVAIGWRGDMFSGVVHVPVAELGIGRVTLTAWLPGGADSARAPLFVSFGENLPVASFDDMLEYLQLYAPSHLAALREASVEERPAAWSEFLEATDPDPTTPAHEGLQQYFARIDVANVRFRDEASVGWQSDRGMVFVAFGEPEQVYEPNPMARQARNRVQVWVYRSRQLQFEFRDQQGTGRWRLTPSSEAAFRAAVQRLPN